MIYSVFGISWTVSEEQKKKSTFMKGRREEEALEGVVL
jgi:hypothetical protein